MNFFNKSKEPVNNPPSEKQKINTPDYTEKGQTGLRQSGGWIHEEFIPRLQWPRAGTVYQEMSFNDPVITAILLCARQLIRKVTWTVVPATKDNPADMEAVEFLKQCMDDMSMPWSDVIDDITTEFEYGFSYQEIVYKKRCGESKDASKRSNYNDNRIGWRKIVGRAQNSISGWGFDDEGGITGVYQSTDKGQVFIPIERSLLFRTTANKGNPEGKSFLRGAYRPWYFKKHIEEIEGIGIERDLAGLPVITAPEGVDLFDDENPVSKKAKTHALQLVTSIRRDRNEGVVLPNGWELKLLSSGSSRQFDTNAVINRYDQRIAITMLADIVMLGADKVGSFALAKVKQSMLSAALDAQLTSIIDIFNRYAIPRLFKLNYFPGITGYPKLQTTSVVAPDLKELGDYIRALSGTNLNLWPDMDLENYLRKVAGLPETDEASSEERAKKAQVKKESTTPEKDPEKDPESDGKEEEE